MSQKKWSRNQKLTLIGLVIALSGAIGSWVHKIDVKIEMLSQKIQKLEVKSAEIGDLKAKIAEIEELKSKAITTNGLVVESRSGRGKTRLVAQ